MEKETKNIKKTASTSKKTTSAKKTTGAKKATASKKKTTPASKKTVKKVETKKVATKAPTKKAVEEVKVKETVKAESVPTKKTEKIVKEVETKKVNAKEETKKDVKVFLNSEVGTLIKIILIVAAVILLFLLITNIINGLKDKNDNLVTSKDIQYDEILVSNLLNQKNSSYYVLVYDANDLYYDAYNTYITSYKSNEVAIRVYTAILSNGFNEKYYSKEESNITSNINDLKFKGTTLVKVENGTIVNAYEDSTSILGHLQTIIK